MTAYLTLVGEVGLTNSGAVGTETGDCSGCSCGWCLEWVGTISDWTFDFGANGSLSSYCHLALSPSVHIDSIEYGWSTNGLGEGGTSGTGIWDAVAYSHNLYLTSPLSGAPNPVIANPNVTMDWIGLGANCDGGSGGLATIDYIRLRGQGTPPSVGTPC